MLPHAVSAKIYAKRTFCERNLTLRRVAAETKRGEPAELRRAARRTAAKFFVKRVFCETFVYRPQRVYQANFFSRAAHAERNAAAAWRGSGEAKKKARAVEALANLLGVGGGF